MKNKKNLLLNAGLALMVIVIALLVYQKFIAQGNRDSSFRIDGIDEVSLSDISGNTLKLTDLLKQSPESYMMIVEITSCNSCIHKGINDLIRLKKAGRYAFVIVVHDNVEDVAGWSATFDFTPFYMMKKTEFYDHISSQLIPVVVKMEGVDIKSHIFITP